MVCIFKRNIYVNIYSKIEHYKTLNKKMLNIFKFPSDIKATSWSDKLVSAFNH